MKIILFILLFLLTLNLNAQEYIDITEEFDNNDANWNLIASNFTDISMFNGSLIIDQKQKGAYAIWNHYLIDPNYDYEIEASITQIDGGKNYGFGLIWGFNGWNDYCKLLITSNKYFMINKTVNNEAKFISNWKRNKKSIKPFGEENIIKISKTNASIKYYINNVLVLNQIPEKFVGTNVGFYVAEKMKIRINHLNIKCKKTKLNLVDNNNTGYQIENLGKLINSSKIEISPTISPDGKTLYFARRTPNLGFFDDDIWLSQLNDNGEFLKAICENSPLNNDGPNWVISISPDGNTLLLGNTYNKDGTTGSGISVSHKLDGKWQFPETQKINNFKSRDQFVNYFLSSDQTKLIISIENEKSFGNCDIYVSFLLEDKTWSEPMNIGNTVNTFAHEFCPFLASDNKTLYFSSYGHAGYGSADIFMSKRLDDTWSNWSTPLNLGPEINSYAFEAYFSVSAKAEYAYMVSNDPKTTKGNEDIYRIKMIESQKPEPVVLIKGKVYNKNTNELINAEIVYENLTTSEQLGKAFSTKEDGFKIVLPKGANYGFRANAKDFISVSENINLDNLVEYKEQEINLYLVPIQRGLTITLHNIFFDFNTATLKKESNAELNRLVDFMKEHGKTLIEVAGHTDNKGSDSYNLRLSNERANAVKNYLVNHEIKETRIKALGLGETKPLESNETEEGRTKNRRVEFTIL